jgi:hypothetical protein
LPKYKHHPGQGRSTSGVPCGSLSVFVQLGLALQAPSLVSYLGKDLQILGLDSRIGQRRCAFTRSWR